MTTLDEDNLGSEELSQVAIEQMAKSIVWMKVSAIVAALILLAFFFFNKTFLIQFLRLLSYPFYLVNRLYPTLLFIPCITRNRPIYVTHHSPLTTHHSQLINHHSNKCLQQEKI